MGRDYLKWILARLSDTDEVPEGVKIEAAEKMQASVVVSELNNVRTDENDKSC